VGRKIAVIILAAAVVIGAALISGAQAPAARGLSDAELAAVKGGAQCRCLKSKKCSDFCFLRDDSNPPDGTFDSSAKCPGSDSFSTCVTANSQAYDCDLDQHGVNCGEYTWVYTNTSCSGTGEQSEEECNPRPAEGMGDTCPSWNTSIMAPQPTPE